MKNEQISTPYVHFSVQTIAILPSVYYFICLQILYYSNCFNTPQPKKYQKITNCFKILVLAKLFQNLYINQTRNSLILWSNLNYRKLLPISCFHLLAYTNPTILSHAMLQAIFLFYSFFRCFTLFKFVIPAH